LILIFQIVILICNIDYDIEFDIDIDSEILIFDYADGK
jgi:hypothetical protein